MGTKEAVYFERTRHIHMWEWISKHPGATKDMYLRENSVPSELNFRGHSRCYACLYAAEQTYVRGTGYEGGCRNCPLEGISTLYACREGLFARWNKYTEMCEEIGDYANEEELTADRSEQVLHALRNLEMECAKEASRLAMEIAHLPVKPGVLYR